MAKVMADIGVGSQSRFSSEDDMDETDDLDEDFSGYELV